MPTPLLEPAAMDKVSFGHEDVEPQEKTRRVRGVFSSVASRYDLMNDLMSGGQHRLWKDLFVRRIRPRPGEAILDMAGGTGDVAFRMARRGAAVTVADINPDMLAVGIGRAKARRIDGLAWTEEIARYDLRGYDGVLAFGDHLAAFRLETLDGSGDDLHAAAKALAQGILDHAAGDARQHGPAAWRPLLQQPVKRVAVQGREVAGGNQPGGGCPAGSLAE